MNHLYDDETPTPLLLAVFRGDCYMAHALIKRGANINTVNKQLNSPLHLAVDRSNFAMVAMLLYYGADADIVNQDGVTPFMLALIKKNIEVQELLLEYEIDFNRVFLGHYADERIPEVSALRLAIYYKSPLIREIVERGAKVGYAEMMVASCSNLDNETLESLWSTFKYHIEDETNTRCNLMAVFLQEKLPISNKDWLKYCSIILHSHAACEIIQYRERRGLLYRLIEEFFRRRLLESDMFPFICACLSWGADVYSDDLTKLHECYGYNKTLKLFLHVGVKINYSFCPTTTIPHLIFDVNKDAQEIFSIYLVYSESDETKNYKKILEYFASPRKYVKTVFDHVRLRQYSYRQSYVELVRNRLLENCVPSLRELSREICRNAIRTQFNISSSSQFYTLLKRLPVPELIKKIIAYEVPLYKRAERSNYEKMPNYLIPPVIAEKEADDSFPFSKKGGKLKCDNLLNQSYFSF